MADKELIEQAIGPEARVELVLTDDKRIAIDVHYEGVQAGADLRVYIKPEILLDKLAEIIPGKMDDMVIEAFKAQFLKNV